jgi:hypothetical protein
MRQCFFSCLGASHTKRPTVFSYKAAHSVRLARPAWIGVQPMIAGLPHQNAPHIKLPSLAPWHGHSGTGRPLATARFTHDATNRALLLKLHVAVSSRVTATDAAAAARRLPPPPLPVRCLSPPKPSLALSSHMVHFFNLRLGSAHLVCVDSILRHSTGTLNRGTSPSIVWRRVKISASFIVRFQLSTESSMWIM